MCSAITPLAIEREDSTCWEERKKIDYDTQKIFVQSVIYSRLNCRLGIIGNALTKTARKRMSSDTTNSFCFALERYLHKHMRVCVHMTGLES